jgi:NADH dehydrogenase
VERDVDLGLNTRLEKVVNGRVTLSDGTELDAGLLVWTAGVTANPIVARFGLPLFRTRPGSGRTTLQVDGRPNVWAFEHCAAVPNAAGTGQVDPPNSQQPPGPERGPPSPVQPYRFRSLG